MISARRTYDGGHFSVGLPYDESVEAMIKTAKAALAPHAALASDPGRKQPVEISDGGAGGVAGGGGAGSAAAKTPQVMASPP